jgi:hypothetical protein
MYQPGGHAPSLFLVYPFLPHPLSQAWGLTFAFRFAFVDRLLARYPHGIAKRVARKLATHSNMPLRTLARFAHHSQHAEGSTSPQACELSRMWQKWLKKAYPLCPPG